MNVLTTAGIQTGANVTLDDVTSNAEGHHFTVEQTYSMRVEGLYGALFHLLDDVTKLREQLAKALGSLALAHDQILSLQAQLALLEESKRMSPKDGCLSVKAVAASLIAVLTLLVPLGVAKINAEATIQAARIAAQSCDELPKQQP